MNNIEKLEATAAFAMAEARRLGATEADVGISAQDSTDVGVRNQKVEGLRGIAKGQSLEFRAFVGKNSATASTSRFRRAAITRLVRATVAAARASQPDPLAGLPEARFMSANVHSRVSAKDMESGLTAEDRKFFALTAEKAARDYDPRITNSEGAGFSESTQIGVYANSHGFVGSQVAKSFSLSVSVVASQGNEMQVAYGWDSKARLGLLDSPQTVGKAAAQKALRKLGGRKVASQTVPVVFDRMIATRFLGQIIGGPAYGTSIARGSSFLVGKLGQKIASDKLTIVDDPSLADGLGSRSFGDEGLVLGKRTIVENGVLQCYLINGYAARQLKCEPNGGSSSNLFIPKGEQSPEEIIGSVSNGLYLTDISGPGFNGVTGDVSWGASGLWIENGKLAYPVEEITVASTVFDMLEALEAVGNDLVFNGRTAAPTLLIGKMMVAGK